MKESVIGDIEFWNTCIVDLKEQARHAKTLKAKVNLAKALNEARGYLKHAERKILALVLLAILLVSGCQTLKGSLGDAAWMTQKLADNINTVKE